MWGDWKRSSDVNVDQDRFANAFDLRNDTFKVECFGKHDLEDLLDVDGRLC
mgnify:CR=1 FL=1